MARPPAFLAGCLGAGLALAATAQAPPPATSLTVVTDDSSPWHTHPPGEPFSVEVSFEGAAPDDSEVVCHWVDAHLQPIGDAIPVTAIPRSIRSPSTEPGFYGLVFSSTDPSVAFSPQPAGVPSSVRGFAVIPDPPEDQPEIDTASPFGLVHANPADPYLRSGSGPRVSGVHTKTMSWAQGARSWSSVAELTDAGHVEMPLIHNQPWNSDDSKPISADQLERIGARFRTVLEAAPTLQYWQTGLEENRDGGRQYDQPRYFSNLSAKLTRMRSEADRMGADVKFVYSTRGQQKAVFERLFGSEAFRNQVAGLAHNPYRWPDFPSPEDWLPDHITGLRTSMDAAGCTEHFLWFGELGIPVRGINDPDAFYGYPDSGRAVPGASLDYAASYLVKSHALALSEGVGRIYVYNYQNRGNDIRYAEDHFGLRSYSGTSADPGHPLPAYVAYINMLAHLNGTVFVARSQPVPGVHVFEFAVTDTRERRLLAWVHPGQAVTLPLSSLEPGLNPTAIHAVTDLYGGPSPALRGERIALDGQPIYLEL